MWHWKQRGRGLNLASCSTGNISARRGRTPAIGRLWILGTLWGTDMGVFGSSYYGVWKTSRGSWSDRISGNIVPLGELLGVLPDIKAVWFSPHAAVLILDSRKARISWGSVAWSWMLPCPSCPLDPSPNEYALPLPVIEAGSSQHLSPIFISVHKAWTPLS